MLSTLYREQPGFFGTQIRQLHKFLIDCCWKYQHLIPQDGLRNGLRGAEKWIGGGISTSELDSLNYHAEAEAFGIDYAESLDEITELKSMIESINEVRELPFEKARKLLLDAAYFAEGSMIYPRFNSLPWIERLFASDFLCPDLLRKHLKPNF